MLGMDGWRLGPGGPSGESVDLEQVVGGADQLPLAVCGDQAPSGDGSDTSVVFDLGEDRLDARGSLLVGLAASWTVELGVMPLIEIPQSCLSVFLTLGACQRSG